MTWVVKKLVKKIFLAIFVNKLIKLLGKKFPNQKDWFKRSFFLSKLQELEVGICVQPNSPIMILILLKRFPKLAESMVHQWYKDALSLLIIIFVIVNNCTNQPGVCVDRPVVCRGREDPRHVVGSRPCFVRFVRYSWIIGIEASLEWPWPCYWVLCGSTELYPLFMVSGDVLRLINWQIIYWLPVGFSFNLFFWSENPVS